jgi:hypothetical protein
MGPSRWFSMMTDRRCVRFLCCPGIFGDGRRDRAQPPMDPDCLCESASGGIDPESNGPSLFDDRISVHAAACGLLPIQARTRNDHISQ